MYFFSLFFIMDIYVWVVPVYCMNLYFMDNCSQQIRQIKCCLLSKKQVLCGCANHPCKDILPSSTKPGRQFTPFSLILASGEFEQLATHV